MHKQRFVTLIFIVLIMAFMVGCGGNAITRSCDTLTDFNNEINSIYMQAQISKEKDPNSISDETLKILTDARNVLIPITTGICNLEMIDL